MKPLRNLLDRVAPLFEEGGRFPRLFPFYEAIDTILYTPGKTTRAASHVRDALDLKRMMMTVVVALIPCACMAMYNTGLQAHRAIEGGAAPLATWQSDVMTVLGLPFSSTDLLACVAHGSLYYLPVLLVTFMVGGLWEGAFAMIRRHEINEGFLVTGMLFPLILPPTIPLWQVALGISFGVVLAKEVFGGTGMNILNPALASRVFLFFAYPTEISGDQAWIRASGRRPKTTPRSTPISPASPRGGRSTSSLFASGSKATTASWSRWEVRYEAQGSAPKAGPGGWPSRVRSRAPGRYSALSSCRARRWPPRATIATSMSDTVDATPTPSTRAPGVRSHTRWRRPPSFTPAARSPMPGPPR